MARAEIGMLAKSIAGHDSGKTYVIVGADEAHLYLADGRIRTMANPKKKKGKHAQVICKKYDISNADDVELKRILKVYDKEMRGEQPCQKLTLLKLKVK